MANGTLKVSNIQTSSGSGTITIGQSGETVTVSGTPSGEIAMTPAFLVSNSANNTGKTDNTAVKLTYDTEVYDTDNAFASSRFTVPTGKAGKYFFTAKNRVIGDSAQGTSLLTIFYKNGSSGQAGAMVQRDYNIMTFMQLAEANGSGDYFEAYAKQQSGGSVNIVLLEFSGFKLIGV